MKALQVLIITGLMLLPLSADARDWRGGAGPRLQAQEQPMKKVPPRGEAPQRPDPEKRKAGRLTQEERRELHRDLDRANREIYRR